MPTSVFDLLTHRGKDSGERLVLPAALFIERPYVGQSPSPFGASYDSSLVYRLPQGVRAAVGQADPVLFQAAPDMGAHSLGVECHEKAAQWRLVFQCFGRTFSPSI